MLKIGLTGGIGSGKTTVSKLFAVLGIPVYYADDAAKWLMENDAAVKHALKDLFGAAAYHSDGRPDRAYIAQKVFVGKEKSDLLSKMEAIIHPAVFAHSEQWAAQYLNSKLYIIREAALTYESGAYQHLDGVIVVTAPKALRIQRVCQRDGSTPEQVQQRINQQMPQDEKVKRADYIIINDGQHPLIPQVIDIHQQLISKALSTKL